MDSAFRSLPWVFAFYGAGFLAYVVALYGQKSQSTWLRVLPGALVACGWAILGVSLGVRWAASGGAYPPWLNPYGAILCVAWWGMGAFLWIEIPGISDTKRGVRWAAPVTLAGVLSLLVYLLKLPGALEPAPMMPDPQRQGWLFGIFSGIGALAYALFLLAGSVSSLKWLQRPDPQRRKRRQSGVNDDGLLSERIQTWICGMGAAVMIALIWKGRWTEFVSSTAGRWSLGVAVGLLTLRWVLGLWISRRYAEEAKPKALRVVTEVVFALALGAVIVAPALSLILKLSLPPFAYAGLSFLFLVGLSAAGVGRREESFTSSMPVEGRVERVTYRLLTAGFIVLSLHLALNAVWGYFARGRYWNWEPHESWGLIVWLFYTVYLHLVVDKGAESLPAAGPRLSALPGLGSLLVIWTLLKAWPASSF